jgi:hypothetical protein
MKVIKIDKVEKNFNFEKAHVIADEKAKAELGDCMNIAFYNDDFKLVSPTLIACSTGNTKDCGAEAYAKSFDAQLEVDVSNRYKFYYRQISDYLT